MAKNFPLNQLLYLAINFPNFDSTLYFQKLTQRNYFKLKSHLFDFLINLID